MLRKTKPRDEPRHLHLADTAPGVEVRTREADDGSLDTVGAILRTLAHTSNEADSRKQLEQWSRHLLVLAPSPREPEAAPSERDWKGARGFTVSYIQRHAETESKKVNGMRDVMWDMIDSVARTVSADMDGDRRAGACIEQLRSALTGPAEDLHAVARQAIGELGLLIQEREARQQELTGTLGGRVAELSLELAEARRGAENDSLTELANRAVFDRELERAAHLSTLTRTPMTLLLIDVDGFKGINDLHGHKVGDDALRAIAKTLALAFPRKTDLVSRYGGDEFAVILSGTTREEGEMLANRFLAHLASTNVDDLGLATPLSASVGVAQLEAGVRAARIFEHADDALYQAKRSGRGRTQIWVE